MKKLSKKTKYWIGAIAVLAIILYLSRKKIMAFTIKQKGLLEPTAPRDETLVLEKGSRGAEVAELQRLLNEDGANLAVDGIFGPLTEAALYESMGVMRISIAGYNAATETKRSELVQRS